jgi:hypothetical protein
VKTKTKISLCLVKYHDLKAFFIFGLFNGAVGIRDCIASNVMAVDEW